jgi:hypothetical protein
MWLIIKDHGHHLLLQIGCVLENYRTPIETNVCVHNVQHVIWLLPRVEILKLISVMGILITKRSLVTIIYYFLPKDEINGIN